MQFDHCYVRLQKASILIFFFPLKYQCCGIIDKNDYDESKWKEQALGGADLNYPLTCCVLDNARDLQSYLNPMPRDKDKCMSSDIRVHRSERYQPVSIITWHKTFWFVIRSATNFSLFSFSGMYSIHFGMVNARICHYHCNQLRERNHWNHEHCHVLIPHQEHQDQEQRCAKLTMADDR